MNTNANIAKITVEVDLYNICIGGNLEQYNPNEVYDLETFDNQEKAYSELDVYTRIAEIHQLHGMIVEQQKEIERLQGIISYLSNAS